MTTTPTHGATELPEALHRVIDDFERRERGIPQAHIASALVAELRAALTAQAISVEPAGACAAELRRLHAELETLPVGYINRGIAPHTKGRTVFHEKPTTNLEARWWSRDEPVFLASQGQAPAQPVDFTTLGAAMRAIQQAIGLIGAPTDERMRAVRRVLRGAVVVAEDSGDIPALPAPPAMDGGEDAEQERPVQRMEGWTDTRYIAELENVARLLRRDREKLHRVRDALSEKGGR